MVRNNIKIELLQDLPGKILRTFSAWDHNHWIEYSCDNFETNVCIFENDRFLGLITCRDAIFKSVSDTLWVFDAIWYEKCELYLLISDVTVIENTTVYSRGTFDELLSFLVGTDMCLMTEIDF
jgi:hypothetical protein